MYRVNSCKTQRNWDDIVVHKTESPDMRISWMQVRLSCAKRYWTGNNDYRILYCIILI